MIGTKLPLRPGELITAITVTVAMLFAIGAAAVGRAQIAWEGYTFQVLLVLLLGTIGLIYRGLRRDERIATATLSGALLLASAAALGTYNYILLPLSQPLLDPWLAQTNALIGYRWSDWVEWLVRYPLPAGIMREVYVSSLWQISILIVGLSFCQRWRELDRMLTTMAFCSVATIVFWGLFPSVSISAFETISAEATRVVRPVVGVEAGAALLDVVRHGSAAITPETMTGLIGFPSFHTILALVCVWFGWKLPLLRLPFLLVNIVMVPAILIHGSHYVVDLLGGALFFFGGLAIADRLLAALETGATAKGQGRDLSAAT